MSYLWIRYISVDVSVTQRHRILILSFFYLYGVIGVRDYY